MIPHSTLMSHHLPNPVVVLMLFERPGGMELCLERWSETLITPHAVVKAVQAGRAAKALAARQAPADTPVEAAVEVPRHHRRLTVEREDAIVAALATAECVADVAQAESVSDQVIYRICRERGVIWPVLSPERRAERIKSVHARMRAAR